MIYVTLVYDIYPIMKVVWGLHFYKIGYQIETPVSK
jgi:hypothetical protein